MTLQAMVMLFFIFFMSQGLAQTSNSDASDQVNLTRQLVLRFLEPYIHYPDRSKELNLLLGEIPSHLSDLIPLPEDSQILGSILFSNDSDIFIHSKKSIKLITEFYEKTLAKDHWERSVNNGRMLSSGFQSVPSGRRPSMTFCDKNKPDIHLYIQFHTLKDNSNDIIIQYRDDVNFSRCRIRQQPSPPSFMPYDPIPVLLSPPNIKKIRGRSGSGGGNEHRYSLATFKTDLDLQVLMKHYEQQLTDAEWTMMNQPSAHKTNYWSVWELDDKHGVKWSGVLSAHHISNVAGKVKLYFGVIKLSENITEIDQAAERQ